jgi:hypothetical protein
VAEQTTGSQPRGKILLEVLGVLIFIVVVAAGLYDVYSSIRLNQQLTDLRSRGLPTNGEELNAWYAVPADGTDTTALWTAATKASADAKLYSRAKGIPLVGDLPEPVPPPGEHWAELEASRAFLKELDHEMQLITVAAAAGGTARYPVDFRDGVNALHTEQEQTRNLARLLSLRAHVHAHDGLSQDVLKDVKGIFAVSESLSHEPVIICQMIRNAVHAMGCVLAIEMLPHCQWSGVDLDELQVAIAQAEFRKNLQRAFYGELAIVLEALETLPSSSIFRIVVTHDNSRSKVIDLMDSSAKAMDLSWAETVERFFPTSLEMMATTIDPLSPVSHVVVSLWLPALQQGMISGIRTEARQTCCIATIAVQRYRLKHGMLPKTLSDLQDFMPNDDPSKSSRLIDPFDGQPLRFKASGDSVVIYSVGENKVDDGGDVDNARRISADLGYSISE